MSFKFNSLMTATVLGLALTACGGGGGGGSDNSSGGSTPGTDGGTGNPPVVTNPNPPTSNLGNNLTALCSTVDKNCGSVNNFTYSGSGTGIWGYTNETAAPVTIEFNIAGAQNKQVTQALVSLDAAYTNLGSTNFSLNQVQSVHDVQKSTVNTPYQNKDNTKIQDGFQALLEQQEADFKKSLKAGASQRSMAKSLPISASVIAYNVGDKQMFTQSNMQSQYVSREYTLSTLDVLPDGRKLNVWVETAELGPNKILASDINAIRTHFLNTYAANVKLNGNPYDATLSTKYPTLIADAPLQPINVMLSNINNDGKGLGTTGYFSPINFSLKNVFADSNEALQVYLDTETVYAIYGKVLNPANPEDATAREEGLNFLKNTLSHEFAHLILFTQRYLINNVLNTSTFANESFALATEDILRNVSPVTDHFITNRAYFFAQGFGANCSFNSWNCANPYERTSVLMAYLVRKYGVPFYKDLIQNTSEDDTTIFNQTIQKHGGKSLTDELVKFQALRAGLANDGVAGFDLPGITSDGFTLVSYNSFFPSSTSMVKPLELYGVGGTWYQNKTVALPAARITLPAKTSFVVVVK